MYKSLKNRSAKLIFFLGLSSFWSAISTFWEPSTVIRNFEIWHGGSMQDISSYWGKNCKGDRLPKFDQVQDGQQGSLRIPWQWKSFMEANNSEEH